MGDLHSGGLLSGGLEPLKSLIVDLATHSQIVLWGLHSGGLLSGGLEHLEPLILDLAMYLFVLKKQYRGPLTVPVG